MSNKCTKFSFAEKTTTQEKSILTLLSSTVLYIHIIMIYVAAEYN